MGQRSINYYVGWYSSNTVQKAFSSSLKEVKCEDFDILLKWKGLDNSVYYDSFDGSLNIDNMDFGMLDDIKNTLKCYSKWNYIVPAKVSYIVVQYGCSIEHSIILRRRCFATNDVYNYLKPEIDDIRVVNIEDLKDELKRVCHESRLFFTDPFDIKVENSFVSKCNYIARDTTFGQYIVLFCVTAILNVLAGLMFAVFLR